MGPTASGKTALACALAERLPLAIISVDSAQVYRGLDIGAAKPDAETRRRYPHALIDLRDPEQTYSAAEFRVDAARAMADAHAVGRIPLLVGGTMLYFQALVRGLSELPDADPKIRQRLAAEASSLGWSALHHRLAERDPAAAARIHPNDPQRISRALEVIELTGRPLSEQQTAGNSRLPFRLLKLALVPGSRADLHRRIEARFGAMLSAGLLDEVRTLCARPGLSPLHPSMRAVGYRQAWQVLDGAIPESDLARVGTEATRQLAKRQLTWLRREHDAITMDPDLGATERRLQVLVTRFLASS